MRKRAWELKRVINDVYCDSNGDITFKIIVSHNTKKKTIYLDWAGYTKPSMYERTEPIPAWLPKYLQAEIEREIVRKIDANEFSVYEVDRDRNQRFNELRYYDPIAMKDMRQRLSSGG